MNNKIIKNNNDQIDNKIHGIDIGNHGWFIKLTN